MKFQICSSQWNQIVEGVGFILCFLVSLSIVVFNKFAVFLKTVRLSVADRVASRANYASK